jgi:YhcH/YjgK/YiaL family protein
MIIDVLKNIDLYKTFNRDLYEALIFVRDAKPDLETGEYPVNENVKGIVSEYRTVEEFERGYEAHKHVIDIQYPLIGLERVKWSPINDMNVNIPYEDAKDRTFYKNPHKQGTHIDIGNGVFAIMFPNDGHSPQHFVEKKEMIRKLTMKISIR